MFHDEPDPPGAVRACALVLETSVPTPSLSSHSMWTDQCLFTCRSVSSNQKASLGLFTSLGPISSMCSTAIAQWPLGRTLFTPDEHRYPILFYLCFLYFSLIHWASICWVPATVSGTWYPLVNRIVTCGEPLDRPCDCEVHSLGALTGNE